MILYSGSWDWGSCRLDNVRRHTGESFPPNLWQQCWAAMPWDSLVGNARPLGWLAQSPLRLAVLCQPLSAWHNHAAEAILGLVLADSSAFDRTVRSTLLRNRVLVHHLNTDGEHALTADHRQELLLGDCDRLWLLEGLALSQGWTNIANRLNRVQQAVEPLLPKLRDEDRPSWATTVTTIERIANEPPEKRDHASTLRPDDRRR
jgi:hypothetical protein